MLKFFAQASPVAFWLRLGLLWLALAGGAVQAQTDDPLESYNRLMFRFNEQVDRLILKPVAQGYKAVTPEFVDTGVSNFFGNLGDFVSLANNILQLKLEQSTNDLFRVTFNSTFGFFGLIDIATPMGLPKSGEDFGQTLGYWGVGEGYYIVLPLLGPTTTRDVWRYPVDAVFYPVSYVDPSSDQLIMRGVNIVDTRADLLRAERAFSEAALDSYAFQREAYLQRRLNQVYDGNPPQPEFNFDEDFDDDLDAEGSEPLPSAAEPATQ